MIPFNIRPEQASQELLDLSRKLGDGLKNLYEMDDIETGVTPKDAVYRDDKLVLYRFKAPDGVAKRQSVPVVIVYALVNRPYMTDLQENRSLVRGLLEAGQDVVIEGNERLFPGTPVTPMRREQPAPTEGGQQ